MWKVLKQLREGFMKKDAFLSLEWKSDESVEHEDDELTCAEGVEADKDFLVNV